MNNDYKVNLKNETNDLKFKVNNLNEFMRTPIFYNLDRVEKDLLYDQYHAMLTYLQILGKRLELAGVKDLIK